MFRNRRELNRKTFVILIAVLGGTVLFYACKDNTSDAPPVPAITSISPTMGPPGVAVTISGSGFGATASANKVTFNGTLAEVSSASETSIEATVPEGATSGAVAVVVGGQTSIGPNFTVEEKMPGISSLEPDSGEVGTEVTITGMNFDPAPSNNIVTFNGGVISEVQQASDTALVTKVPAGAESGPIQVEVGNSRTLSPSFKVLGMGTLNVFVSTTGSDRDEDGYIITIDQEDSSQVGLDELIVFEDLIEGTYDVKLGDIANNCTVSGSNPRSISMDSGDNNVSFDIYCKEVLKNQIVFTSNRSGDSDIYAMNIDGTNLFRITNTSVAEIQLSISPDGEKIAFSKNSNIYVMDADGTNENQITSIGNDTAPEWSPDGTQIAFTSSRDGNNEIYLMDNDGSNKINITQNSADDITPAWSPGGSSLAFVSDRDGENEIFEISIDGMIVNQLTDNTDMEFTPDWSADGTQIVFSRNDDIYVMNSDGSNQTFVIDPTLNPQPVWSADDNRILYGSDTVDGGRDLFSRSLKTWF